MPQPINKNSSMKQRKKNKYLTFFPVVVDDGKTVARDDSIVAKAINTATVTIQNDSVYDHFMQFTAVFYRKSHVWHAPYMSLSLAKNDL